MSIWRERSNFGPISRLECEIGGCSVGNGDHPFVFEAGAYPECPGIYRMLDSKGSVLYIGKAGHLRRRLQQYFSVSGHDGRFQLTLLLSQVQRVEVIATRDERDALILENQLIKRHAPKFNIRLKDGKTYPYIRLSKDAYPRIEISRNMEDDDYRRFGPYTNVAHATRLVELMSIWFGLRRCPGVPVKMLERPCLYAQIGQCSAPCVGRVGEIEYQKGVEQAVRLLKGDTASARAEAQKEMKNAAGERHYERAAMWRDIERALGSFERSSLREDGPRHDMDIIAHAEHRGWFMVAVLQVRDGQLLGSETVAMHALEEWDASVAAFILSWYTGREIPGKLIVEECFDDVQVIGDILGERSGKKVRVLRARGEVQRGWLEMTRQNARAELSCREATGDLDDVGEYLERVRSEAGLSNPPRYAIALDASIFGVEEPVGSVVVFKDGKPSRGDYRHYRIKLVEGGAGDLLYIHEILKRYLKRVQPQALPDCILIDGGELQLAEAAKVMREFDMEPQGRLMSLSKGPGRKSGEEQLHRWGKSASLQLRQCPMSMSLWTHLRDEAHRFALRYGRKRLSKSRLRLSFSNIPGIGPKTVAVLRRKFSTLDELLNVQPEVLESMSEIGPRQRRKLLDLIRGGSDLGKS